MNINDAVRECHEISKSKGWHDEERSPLDVHMLIVSELAEATEAVRKSSCDEWVKGEKPEGEAVELVDAVIRIFDYFGAKGWDFEETLKAKMEYNRTRPYRHGGKKY